MTPEETLKTFENHTCTKLDMYGGCDDEFEYQCPYCGRLENVPGAGVLSNEIHGWECGHCYAYGTPITPVGRD